VSRAAFSIQPRELREEIGCEALEWIPFGSYPVNGNHGGGKGHLFITLDIHKVGEPIKDDLEETELVEFTIEEVKQKLFQGAVKVQDWVAIIAMGLLYLKKKELPAYC
jgi:ADP-ribose pyrophosphatase